MDGPYGMKESQNGPMCVTERGQNEDHQIGDRMGKCLLILVLKEKSSKWIEYLIETHSCFSQQ